MSSRVNPARVHVGEVEAQPFCWRQVEEGAVAVSVPLWTPPATAASPERPAPAREEPGEIEQLLAEATARAQAAQQQGFQAGLAQGRAEGEQKAKLEVTPLIERLARTVADLSGTRDAFRREAEEDVVRLALGVARRILHREVSIDPEALTGIIHVALGKFEARELHRVRVSVDDHPAVAAALQALRLPRGVEAVADPTLERGAALFETVKGTLDASVDTQLDEIERGFLDVLGKEGRRG